MLTMLYPDVANGVYDRQQVYITPDGRDEFTYYKNGKWDRFDWWDGDTDTVTEDDLPDDLVLKHVWQEQQAQRERVAALFGQVEQLSLALAVDC